MKQLKWLISVKKIIALLLTLCFIYITIAGKVTSEFLSIYTMIVGFYFGQSTVRSTNLDNKTE